MKIKKIFSLALTILFVGAIALFIIFKAKEPSLEISTIYAMDTVMTFSVYSGKSFDATKACTKEIERLDDMLSTGKESSEVSRLNQEKDIKVSSDTLLLLEESKNIYDLTDGAFNVAVYPLMEAWGFAGGNFRVPEKSEIEDLTQIVNNPQIQCLREKSEVILGESTKIDLGGIAKGYAGDCLIEILKNNGVKSAMLNLGGNVAALGYKEDGTPWVVGINSPAGNGELLGKVSVTDKAVVTSGGYERFFEEEGIVYHHIIDPNTGYPAESGVESVTIITEKGIYADALSTSLFVMGLEKATGLYKKSPVPFEFVLLTDEDKLYVTEGLKGSFSSEKEICYISKK